jgi:hypothetical protein
MRGGWVRYRLVTGERGNGFSRVAASCRRGVDASGDLHQADAGHHDETIDGDRQQVRGGGPGLAVVGGDYPGLDPFNQNSGPGRQSFITTRNVIVDDNEVLSWVRGVR